MGGVGCSSAPSVSMDGSVDARRTDGAVDVGNDGPPVIGPLATSVPPQELVVPSWVVATENTPTGDRVGPALEHNTFVLPSDGSAAYNINWFATPPDTNDALGRAPVQGLLYAAAQLDVPAGMHAFARVDTVSAVYTNGVLQPGDVYGTGRIRVPLAVHPGTNVVVLQAQAGGSQTEAQIWTTPDEVYFNTSDAILPDLVAGDTSEQFVGVAVLNLTDAPALGLVARVEESDSFYSSAISLAGMGAGAVTQIAFDLLPKGPYPPAGTSITVGLRIESPSLRYTYRTTVTLHTVAPGAVFHRTFRSRVDGSAQYYAVAPPTPFDPTVAYGMLLTLHGANTEGFSLAQQYSPKDWLYIIAPTNRRPYGFDWEEWGTLDALEVLDHATESYHPDPTRIYLAGHSMGGHGTWHIGTLFPGRFATLGPSGGWISFYSYTHALMPTGAFARSEAASNTLAYMSNLAHRGVYVIHGGADPTVPVSEAEMGVAAARMYTSDVDLWIQPGANHYWTLPGYPGRACVDWPPLFAFMQAHRLDPTELDFTFTTPSPSVSPTHSYVTVLSESDAHHDCVVSSAHTGSTVTVTTSNVRGMQLDGAMLASKGVTQAVVNGAPYPVSGHAMAIGPQDGKRPGVHGPLNEVFHQPWCFVYPDGATVYRQYAAYLLSNWSLTGNGQACALPLSALSTDVRAAYNIVYLGVASGDIPALVGSSITWDANRIALPSGSYPSSAMAMVFPENGRLSAAFTGSAGSEYLLFRLMPLEAGFAAPDYLVFDAHGTRAAGFFAPDWSYLSPW